MELSESRPAIRTDLFKLLALFAVAGVPVILAMVMYIGKIGVPTERTNHGHLVLPPLDAGTLVDVDASLETPDPWTLVTFGSGACDEVCQQSLYKIRQVNIALGRDANRVRHMLLAMPDNAASLSTLTGDYPNLVIRQVEPARLETLLQPLDALRPQRFDLYIVDPLGNLMMHYPASQSGNDILDDLKKLLRVSKIG